MQYETEIRKDGRKYLVIGELWDDGVAYWDNWGEIVEHLVIQEDPEFNICEMYDNENNIIPLTTLTAQEIYNIIEIFTIDYWDKLIEKEGKYVD